MLALMPLVDVWQKFQLQELETPRLPPKIP